MENLSEVIKNLSPGVVGAAGSTFYTRGHKIKRVFNVFLSSATVFYTYEYVANLTGLPVGLTSFFIGVFAAPLIEKMIEEIYEIEFSKIWTDFIRKVLRIEK